MSKTFYGSLNPQIWTPQTALRGYWNISHVSWCEVTAWDARGELGWFSKLKIKVLYDLKPFNSLYILLQKSNRKGFSMWGNFSPWITMKVKIKVTPLYLTATPKWCITRIKFVKNDLSNSPNTGGLNNYAISEFIRSLTRWLKCKVM